MRKTTLIAGLIASAMASRSGAADQPPAASEIPRSVVKVVSIERRPVLSSPWTYHPQVETTGSGVVIEGQRILTNAQLVKYCSQITIEVEKTGEKHAATIEYLADDVDLALLKIDDPKFFEAHPPLPRNPTRPRIKDVIYTYGYPLGGDNLSITRGIVSRIEFEEYYYGTYGLRVQVDAAINSGNSGGPALIDDKLVGIIFNRFNEADNIGYIIPNEEIDLFVKDVADGKYDGKPQIVEVLNRVQNKALRSALKLPKDLNGLVCRNPAGSFADSTLKPMDVVTAIGDHPIDVAGQVKVDDDLRLDYRYYVQHLARDGFVPVKVVRDGAPIDLSLRVPSGPARNKLLPKLMGRDPSYFIWGPFAFTAAADDHIDELDAEGMASRWYPYLTYNQNPMAARRGEFPRFEGERLVISVGFFPHRIGKGYSDPSYYVVDTVDGTKVKNLRHLAELLLNAKGEQVTITFLDKAAEVYVFDLKEVAAVSEEILGENSIRNAYSADLKDLFKPEK